MTVEDKKATTTVRLSDTSKSKLKRATGIWNRSQTQIIEEALQDWFDKHGLTESYQLLVSKTHYVLIRLGKDSDIVDSMLRNGVSPETIAEQYAGKFQARVTVKNTDAGEQT